MSIGDIAAILGGADPIPQVTYTFRVVNGPDGGWRVRRVALREGLSELYECALELATDDLGADVAGLAGASCVLEIHRGNGVRRLCGIATRTERRGTVPQHLLAQVILEPALSALDQTQDSRIFQNQSVKDILTTVLSDELTPYDRAVRFELGRTYLPREYCTQYGESDFEFARRLMAEEGIFFYFDHSGEQEELVLADLNQKCPDYVSSDGNPIPVTNPLGPQGQLPVETIDALFFGRELCSTAATLRDFDWTDPGRDLTYPQPGNPSAADGRGRAREVYAYPAPQILADYDSGAKKYTREEGKLHADLFTQRQAALELVASGQSNVTGLGPGLGIEMGGELPPGLDPKQLVIHVEHEGEAADEVHFHLADVKLNDRYHNRFTTIPRSTPFRPAAGSRPVPGSQTATVVGPSGEEIFTDEHGRIKVQFHWDREGQGDESSSCWVRVSQIWAGAGWGTVFLPRIGMEVAVEFLEGNPDRPLVTGCVYNGTHPPPYDLPADKTRSTIKTSSSLGHNGSNELRFEDAAGKEEVYIHAQKDMNEVVKHDHSESVQGDESTSIGGNQSVTVKGKGSSPVHDTVNVTGKYQMDASDTIEEQAPTHIKLTCGGSSINIEPGKITISAGGGSSLTLDQNAFTRSSQGSQNRLDANAFTQASGGAETLLDANVLVQSKAQTAVVLDANALTHASGGAETLLDGNAAIAAKPKGAMVLDANATLASAGESALVLETDAALVGKVAATVKAGAAATITSPESTLVGGGGAVAAKGSDVKIAGGLVGVLGGMVTISSPDTKINS